MTKKLEHRLKTRVSVRLDLRTLNNVDIIARPDETRTSVIERALRLLHHDCSFSTNALQLRERLVKRIPNDCETRNIQLRIDTMLVEYFRLNCYNLTSAIKLGVSLLKNPNLNTKEL